MSLKIPLFFLISLIAISSCRSDSQENSRAYVEGKIISATVDYNKFTLQIISNNVVMAQTVLDAGGDFKLSGPVSTDGFSVVATEKIKSFKTEKSGLTLAPDALHINVPKGITYIKFNEIVLEK